ncbi:MlaE family ABC transporter permease [Polluticoccus soli]|uniref:MlaE family ABC transporter permease n=1 Tax=Polluticoccus soli TaxID=3034150 RepID=UPI0023E19585|nr:ABC transporter permease [Flavipsychrobacter sp. JY13-12]
MASATELKKHVISKNADGFFSDVHKIFLFIIKFFREAVAPPYEFRELVNQCYQVGYKSLFIISVTSFITGIVFTAHSRPELEDFGAASWLPSISGVAIMKALAPLITALICAGKSGSHIGAELGSMKVTEQIDAMEVSAVNPFKFLVVTRVLATTFMIPLLMLYSSLIGLIGSYTDVFTEDQSSFPVFIHNAFARIGYAEAISSILRSVVFGFTIGIVGCYKGLTTTNGTEGVGKAANSAVVTSMLLIFLEEMVIVKLFVPLYVQR